MKQETRVFNGGGFEANALPCDYTASIEASSPFLSMRRFLLKLVAESKCWSMLKGCFASDSTGPAELYFESKNTSVEIWVDCISLQPFTPEEWTSRQENGIEKVRKSNVRIQVVDKQNNPLRNATISIQQKRSGLPIGCAINSNILSNTASQKWFTSRFCVTTFENEMKWYSTERSPGHEDYSSADAMLSFAKRYNIAVQGHNVVWDDPKYQAGWLYSLLPTNISKAVFWRVNSVMSRYKGQLIAWDVVNENQHFSFFESRMGNQESAEIYRLAHAVDPLAPLFLNNFNTIEDHRDGAAAPAKICPFGLLKLMFKEAPISVLRVPVGDDGLVKIGQVHGLICGLGFGSYNVLAGSLVDAYAKQLSFGRQVRACSLKCHPTNDVAMGNALIDMYAKCVEIKDANKVFNEMDERNVVSWTSLIAGYGKHGYGHENYK
ncbi:putative Glycosyl hydrolase family 10 protein [Hibiscus syriacus]|uniref:Glycosyl hydrolase family 10 protein n=1 Tax=Hibiscus syriacus TaxID=106335 RepID=A0A6A2Y8K1_HIBSY|nr:putative Glycosyl hydrolase family 10 protein [Hibiscus syriacus]